MNRLLILFLLTAALSARAGIERNDTKESLRGLNGVYVVVQLVDEQPAGMTTNHFETLVKSALTGAGIPVNAEPKKSNGDPNLSVTVDIIHQPQLDVYVFTMEVAVTQDVQLTRPVRGKNMSAETWARTRQGITSPDRLDVIDQTLKLCMDAFVADYQAVNPPAQ
jgi:hypothetical protein